VAHDPLPAGSGLTMSWEIDGVPGNAIGVTTGQETRFAVNTQGYAIETTLGMTHDDTGTRTPIVRSVNVIWDFVKVRKHQYLLDCRTGVPRWNEDPETAIGFLFSTANERATFEDRFIGEYTGTIEEVQFAQANRSMKEGYSGLVRVTVREEA
jgi:predicted PhzF superfamily epimerase YddE/YHI9